MTHRSVRAATTGGSALAAALAGLALAGCSATHVGESWQCPIAQGSECESVAAADPALPDEAPAPVLGEPLYRAGADGDDGAREKRTCGAGCGAGFGPFAWLAQVLGIDGTDAGEPPGAGTRAAPEADGAAESSGDTPAGAMPGAPDEARVPVAGATGARAGSAHGTDDANEAPRRTSAPAPPTDEALREPEAIGRIWIAPFVDADGIYREGTWVRAVLAPAGWRRP